MPNPTWHRRYSVKQHTLASNAATYAVDLPARGAISALLVRLAWTNGATDSAQEDIIDSVDKIEVIGNGSHEIASLSGIEAAKLAYFVTGRGVPQVRDFRAAAVQSATFVVPFGHYVCDPEFWIRASEWSSLELKITYSPTIATNGFATGTGVLDVIGIIAPETEPGVHRGYMRTRQLVDTTTAASGDLVVSIPRQHDLSAIMVYCFETAIADGVDVTEVELSLNDGSITPFTGRWVDLQEEQASRSGVISRESGVAFNTDAESFETRCGRVVKCGLQVEADIAATGDFPVYFPASLSGGTLALSGILVEASATWAATALDTTNRAIHWWAEGAGVGNALWLPCDWSGDPETAIHTPDYGAIDLVLTQGGAGGALRVATREIVRV